MIIIRGEMNWANLLDWLEACHAGRRLAMGIIAEHDPTNPSHIRVMGRIFRLCGVLIDLPWPTIKAALEVAKDMVGATDGTWVWR